MAMAQVGDRAIAETETIENNSGMSRGEIQSD